MRQVGIVLALPQLLAWRYFPSTPKRQYLVAQDKKKALKSMQFYHGTTERAGTLHPLALRKEHLSVVNTLRSACT